MFQTFTGSSRRPRQVNLSGRNSNPFAPTAAQSPTHGAPSAAALARQQRESREQDKHRLNAVKNIQRTWRGHATRQELKRRYRHEFDEQETQLNRHPGPDEEQYYSQLRLLVHFADPRDSADVQRLLRWGRWLGRREIRGPDSRLQTTRWRRPLGMLAHICLAAVDFTPRGPASPDSAKTAGSLLHMLRDIVHVRPDDVADYAQKYYGTLGRLYSAKSGHPGDEEERKAAIVGPLRCKSPKVYRAFVTDFLTLPAVQEAVGQQSVMASLDSQLVASTSRGLMSLAGAEFLQRTPAERLLWLLAYLILIWRNTRASLQGSDIDYIVSFSALISNLSPYLRQSIHGTINKSSGATIPAFVTSEIQSLITQENIGGLLVQSQLLSSAQKSDQANSTDAAALATYALTLLQVFPLRRDDIRMWLFQGSTSIQIGLQGHFETVPAIKYFWEAIPRSQVFRQISAGSQNAARLLRDEGRQGSTPGALQHEWRIIFLFLELYSCVLRVMDDEEFMTGAKITGGPKSWTRQSALKLSHVKDLTVFLKNLAFAMYWHSSDILDMKAEEGTNTLSAYFSNPGAGSFHAKPDPPASQDIEVGGITGMTLSYVKGMTTGVLRMIYERDSRRKFLPKDHWLISDVDFESENFIVAVVQEEHYRHQSQDKEEDEDEDELSMYDEGELDRSPDARMIISTHTQQIRRQARLKEQQYKVAKRKHMARLLPRLEILQNTPFFIPFATRVQIFREFVTEDQMRRRNELGIQAHHASVSRDRIFDDAFDAFFKLGDGLKGSIQITFVDQFGTNEAGIDGGGVTKEFLTSITSEAFSSRSGYNLFAENDQNLLYPNPSAVDEIETNLRELGGKPGTAVWNQSIRELLQRFEFLGRIIGKCLYEGILVDVHFAPFFLVKWALFGGPGSAANESSYRASIDDLRDLDEALYQGLLQLKNYPGNVEDFSLDFTVTDPASDNKNIVRDLVPNGSTKPVTNQNRLMYIAYMARHRLQNQPRRQTAAFLRGLSTMIQPSWLSMFNQAELQTLLGGDASPIDVTDLRNNTVYGGVYVIGDDGTEHPTVQMFWEVMHGLPDEERRKVLKYVTSTPRGPLLGFDQLKPRFSIRDSGSEQSRLPSSSTCVNLLKLPAYVSKQTLREKLLYAVNSGAGFDLS